MTPKERADQQKAGIVMAVVGLILVCGALGFAVHWALGVFAGVIAVID